MPIFSGVLGSYSLASLGIFKPRSPEPSIVIRGTSGLPASPSSQHSSAATWFIGAHLLVSIRKSLTGATCLKTSEPVPSLPFVNKKKKKREMFRHLKWLFSNHTQLSVAELDLKLSESVAALKAKAPASEFTPGTHGSLKSWWRCVSASHHATPAHWWVCFYPGSCLVKRAQAPKVERCCSFFPRNVKVFATHSVVFRLTHLWILKKYSCLSQCGVNPHCPSALVNRTQGRCLL